MLKQPVNLTRRFMGMDSERAWCKGVERWICPKGVNRLFILPRGLNSLTLHASASRLPGAVRVSRLDKTAAYSRASVNGQNMALYETLWDWLFASRRPNTWYLWVEYDTNDGRNK